MDNLGDWLYIVLLVVAGISGLLSSVKKKRQTEEVERQPDVEDIPEFWDWETPPIPLPAETQETLPPLKKTALYVPLFKEGERSIATPEADFFSDRQTEESAREDRFTLSGDDFRDINDLKKAIVYSEILNRKY
jgi:hypothetical protein